MPTENEGAAKDAVKKTWFFSGVAAMYLVVILMVKYLWQDARVYDTTITWQMSAFTLLLVYTLGSIRVLDPEDIGTKVVLGYPLYQLGPGPAFVPLLICELRKNTGNVIMLEVSAENAGKLPKAEGEELLMYGRTKDFHIVFADGDRLNMTPEEKKQWQGDPFYHRVTTDPTVIIRWRIGVHSTFLRVIGSLESANRQMEDAAIAELGNQAGLTTLAQALSNLNELSSRIRKAVEETIGESGPTNTCRNPWGIELENVMIKIPGVTKSISQAQAARAGAQDTAEATRIAGKATADSREYLEAAILTGIASGVKLAKDAGIEVNQAVALQVAKAIADGQNKTVYLGESAVANAVAGFKAKLNP